MAKDKSFPSKGALKIQIAFFIVLLLMAILPLGFMLYLGLLASLSYLSVSGYESYVLNIGLCASTIFLLGAIFLYTIGNTLQKRWQNYKSLEIEIARIHDLLEDKAIEDVPETEAYQKLSAKTKLEL